MQLIISLVFYPLFGEKVGIVLLSGSEVGLESELFEVLKYSEYENRTVAISFDILYFLIYKSLATPRAIDLTVW